MGEAVGADRKAVDHTEEARIPSAGRKAVDHREGEDRTGAVPSGAVVCTMHRRKPYSTPTDSFSNWAPEAIICPGYWQLVCLNLSRPDTDGCDRPLI